MLSRNLLLSKKFHLLKRFYASETFLQYKHSCTNLLSLSRENVKQFFNYLQAIVTDADGVLWLHEKPIEGSAETFNYFGHINKKTFVVTNNSTRTRENLTQKASSMGLQLTEDQIVCTAHATANYLKSLNFTKTAYIIGSQGLASEFTEFGIKHTTQRSDPMQGSLRDLRENLPLEPDVGAVIVAFDQHLSYPKLAKSCVYLQDPNCLFLVTNRDEQIPTPGLTLPGTGCFAAAIEAGSERRALLIGKPNKDFVEPLFKKGLIKPETTLMIGDRGSTDMRFGYNCGFFTLFVCTGTNSLADIKKWQSSKDCEIRKMIPDFYVPKMGDLLKILRR